METLIIILLVVLIVQTGVFIYSHFFDIHVRKENAATVEMLLTATKQYQVNVQTYQDTIRNQGEQLKRWQLDYAKLAEMHNASVVRLPGFEEKIAMTRLADGVGDDHDKEVIKNYLDALRAIRYDDEKNIQKREMYNPKENESKSSTEG